MLALAGIPQVALTVKDLEEAVGFYQNTLGLKLLFRTPQMAMFSCGATRVLLGTPEQSPTGQSTFVYFQTDDIGQAVKALAKRGVKMGQAPHAVGRFEGREVWLATFYDPAGNLHHLISEVKVDARPVAPS